MRIMCAYIQRSVYVPKILDGKKPKRFLSLASMFFVYFYGIGRLRFLYHLQLFFGSHY